jgi:hypothetical protein
MTCWKDFCVRLYIRDTAAVRGITDTVNKIAQRRSPKELKELKIAVNRAEKLRNVLGFWKLEECEVSNL